MEYEIGCKLSNTGDLIPYSEVMREIMLDDLKVGEYYTLKVVKMSEKKARSIPQNNAMYLFFKKLAKKLNDSGFDKRMVFEKMSKGFFIGWSSNCVKQYLWKPIMVAVSGKESTAKLERDDVSQIYENVNKFTSERLNFHEPFPSIDGLMFENEINEKAKA